MQHRNAMYNQQALDAAAVTTLLLSLQPSVLFNYLFSTVTLSWATSLKKPFRIITGAIFTAVLLLWPKTVKGT